MTRKIIIGIGVASMLFLTGCGQPSFNKNTRNIVFKNGKPYFIPRGVHYGVISKKQAERSKEVIELYRKSGNAKLYHYGKSIVCPAGNVLWYEPNALKESQALENKYSQQGRLNEYRVQEEINRFNYNILRSGKSGCEKPLSQQEYQYRVNQQNQGAADRRVSSQNAASMIPRTYNIKHSGSVDVYKY